MLRKVGVRCTILALLGPALVPIGTATAQSAPPQYSVTDLGTLPGYDTSTGSGINDSGQVVGTLQQAPYGQASAFVWSSATGLRALGTFMGRSTTGAGINNSGDVAGSAIGFVYDPGFAFSWDSTTGFSRLDPPSGFFGSAGAGINDSGQVAGTAHSPAPVRWEANGQAQSLGSLGGIQGIGNAINNNGQVVGYSRNSRSYPRPFLWDPQTGMRDLGTFRRGASNSGVAYGINDLGHVVGHADTNSGFSRAFLWRNGRLTAVGPEISFAYGVNDLDHVVGQYLVNFEYHAFVNINGVVSDLNTLIPSGSGIVLTTARAINNDGLIVANGTNRAGQQRAFVLTPQ